MYRYIPKLLVLLGLFLSLGQTLVQAQEAVIHMTSVSWDANVELTLDLGVTTDEGVHCIMSMLTVGDECDQILAQLGDPQLSLSDNPQFAIIEWQELPGYSNYSVCVTKSIFDAGPEIFATHLTVKNYVNSQLTQVYMVPITNDSPYCISDPSAYGNEVLPMDFIVDVASVIPVTVTPSSDSDLIVRLIQPTENHLSLLADVTKPTSLSPNFVISTRSDAVLETTEGTYTQDALLSHEDFAGLYNLSLFVSYVSPTSVAADNDQTVPFAVAVYDQGQLSAIYFGQVTGANQIWLASYPSEPVMVQDYPVYDPIFSIVAALANPQALG